MKTVEVFAVAVVFAVLALGVRYMIMPRGLRNNNPGNIRHGDEWEGMREVQTDDAFVQFKDPVYGIRAMARVLKSYSNRGVVYLSDIILTWAPEADSNDVHAYIASVEQSSGLYGNEIVEPVDYPNLIAAIIRHENGSNPYSMAVIEQGVALA